METRRVEYLDIAKGIGMVCVVLGHMGNETISSMIYPFHMPLFYIISGYLLNCNKTFPLYVKDKFIKLLQPYFYTCVFIALTIILKGGKNFYSSLGIMFHYVIDALYGVGNYGKTPAFIEGGIGALWFFWSLFWALIFTRYAVERRKSYIWLGIIVGVSYLTSNYVWLPFSIQMGGVASIFVYCGYVLRNKGVFDKFDLKLFVFGCALWVVAVKCDISMNMVQNYYSHGVLSVIVAIFICYMVIQISKYIASKEGGMFKRGLVFIGKNSLYALCVHYIEMRVIDWSKLLELLARHNAESAYLVLFPCKFFIIVTGVYIINKIRLNISRKRVYK